MLPNFLRLRNPKPEELPHIQDEIWTSLLPVFAVALLDGKRIADVALSTTAIELAHGLGRPWIGYLVTRMDADARVWSPAQTTDPAAFLPLDASGTATVDLWVF